MATDVKDAEMTECEEDKVVTMMDVLQEQQDFEENANAVLGASDDKNCTYSKGYIKRQALYACMTCSSEAKSDLNKRAGLCLACSLTCHENHELIELYTKRNFRCDCGNSKFTSHPCQLSPNKAEYNEENSYNQNFSGLYCVCHRPYPDPECAEEDVMIQCTICEDWYHGSHLETTVPSSDLYSEMICKECMEKNEFLHSYSSLIVNVSDNGIKPCNGNIEISTKKDEKSHLNGNTQIAPKVSECSPNDESNINNTDEYKKQDVEETSNQTVNVTENITVSATDANNLEKLTSETQLNCNNDNTENKKTESNSDISNEQNASNDKVKKENINQSKNEMNVTLDQKETDPDAANTARNLKKIHENDTTVIANNKLTQQVEEKLEEDRLLADPESENSHMKTDIDNTKTSCEDNKTNTNEKKNANDDNKEVKILNAGIDLVNSDKKEPVKEFTENITKSDCGPITHGDNDIVETTNNDMKGANGECSQDKNLCQESDMPNHKLSEKRKLSTEENLDFTGNKKTKFEEENDKLCSRPKDFKKVYTGATFWPSNFRQKLCTCKECLSMYKDLSLLFLIDTDDTVIAYESLGKEKMNGGPSQYEKGLEALSSLDRIQQINALTEYNKMRDKLLDFLKSFKDRKEVVKEEDIKAFFAGMKPKREPDGVYFCR